MRKYLKRIYNKSQKDYYSYLSNEMRDNNKRFIITANPETITMAEKDEEISKMLLDDNNSIVPDGIAIVKACKILKIKVTERIAGVDIAQYLLEECNRQKKTLYLFGAKPEVIQKLAEMIKIEYPNIELLGYSDGYVNDKDKVFEEIIKLKPDVCLVALGIPYQEKIIYKHLSKFKKGIFVGVGGSFDVLSGSKKRAPKLFIKLNLEWLYRIICEPKRIKRFWDNNIKFIFKTWKETKTNKKEKKQKKKLISAKKILKNNWPICIIMIISLIMHIIALKELGFNYTLNSDDASYINSGITFLKSGKITMHGDLSAQIMPGMTFFIALFGFIFGTGTKLIISLKIFWMLMGIFTIYIVYKTIRIFANKYISTLPCIFFLAADYIWMDNIILTETPYIFLFSLIIYYTLKIAIQPCKKYYICIVIFYLLAVFIRPNIGIYPICLFAYLLLKKYDIKLLFKQCIIAGIILLLLLIPWSYRNYKVFGKFIPLTYGMGNPLLLGTYQGVGYPQDEELDYKSNVDDKMASEMKYYIENPEIKHYMTRYYLLEYDGMKAKYRMDEWWKRDKLSMLKSYFIYKPIENVYNVFYWDTIFDIEAKEIKTTRKVDILLFLISSFVIIIDKKKLKEWLFLVIVYGIQVALYSYTFAFSRYAITMFFIRYLIIGIGIAIIYDRIKNRSGKNESINDNTSIQ